MGRVSSAVPKRLFTTIGDLVYASAVSNPARLAAVASGQVLTAQGVGAAPAWAASGFTSRMRAYRSPDVQSIPDGIWTKVQLNNEDFDNLNEFDPVTNYRFTATAAGGYLIIGSVYWLANGVAGGQAETALYKNGAATTRGRIHAVTLNDADTSTAVDILVLAVSDYVELFCYQASGGADDVYGNSLTTYMSIMRLW